MKSSDKRIETTWKGIANSARKLAGRVVKHGGGLPWSAAGWARREAVKEKEGVKMECKSCGKDKPVIINGLCLRCEHIKHDVLDDAKYEAEELREIRG
jgi:hypothetical protein